MRKCDALDIIVLSRTNNTNKIPKAGQGSQRITGARKKNVIKLGSGRQRSGGLKASLGKYFSRHYLKITQHKAGLVRAPVAHACNPSYPVGGDQEDHSLKPAGQIVCEIQSQKDPSQKRAG
jgi:hypothetical protein